MNILENAAIIGSRLQGCHGLEPTLAATISQAQSLEFLGFEARKTIGLGEAIKIAGDGGRWRFVFCCLMEVGGIIETVDNGFLHCLRFTVAPEA